MDPSQFLRYANQADNQYAQVGLTAMEDYLEVLEVQMMTTQGTPARKILQNKIDKVKDIIKSITSLM